MLMILYNGDVNGEWHLGWRDNFNAKAAYLVSLVNVGVVAHSTFLTMQTQTKEAWQVV